MNTDQSQYEVKPNNRTGRNLKNPAMGHVEKTKNLSIRPYLGDIAKIRSIEGWQEMLKQAVKYIIKHGKAPEI